MPTAMRTHGWLDCDVYGSVSATLVNWMSVRNAISSILRMTGEYSPSRTGRRDTKGLLPMAAPRVEKRVMAREKRVVVIE